MSASPAPPPGDHGFLSRWARRKAQARPVGPTTEPALAGSGEPEERLFDAATPTAPRVPGPVSLAPAQAPARHPLAPAPGIPGATRVPAAGAGGPHAPSSATPLPTLADVARLTRESDFAPFMARGVDETVKRAALKKLFSDPRFNVMDGLDVYIDDYSRPDPLPLAALRRMTTTAALGLVRETPAESNASPTEAPAPPEARIPAEAHAAADDPRALADAPASADAASVDLLPPSPATPSDPSHRAASTASRHDDPDLQLQPDDAAGRRSSV